MKKITYLFKETFHLIKKNKIYFFAPFIIFIIILALLAWYIGPAIIVSFIYAGI